MHLLFALAAFLVLSLRAPGEQFITAQQQLAYLLGGVLARTAFFTALHAIVFFGARLIRRKERIASFTATRLSYLTLALSMLVVAAR